MTWMFSARCLCVLHSQKACSMTPQSDFRHHNQHLRFLCHVPDTTHSARALVEPPPTIKLLSARSELKLLWVKFQHWKWTFHKETEDVWRGPTPRSGISGTCLLSADRQTRQQSHNSETSHGPGFAATPHHAPVLTASNVTGQASKTHAQSDIVHSQGQHHKLVHSEIKTRNHSPTVTETKICPATPTSTAIGP